VSFGSECKYELKPSDLVCPESATSALERLIWATSWETRSDPVW
jgi:hypothetical protein